MTTQEVQEDKWKLAEEENKDGMEIEKENLLKKYKKKT